MGRSQETSNKKEVRNRKEKKRKAKVEKREKKRIEGKKGGFDNMIAYVDEFGRISATPPDPEKKIAVDASQIEYSASRNKPKTESDFLRKGIVISFNESKGYGFIRDLDSNKSVFVHFRNLEEPVKENNTVVFEIGKGAKGPMALNVRLFKG